MLEVSSGERRYKIPETQIKPSDLMQDESVKIRPEKEAGTSSSKTVPNQVGVPVFKSLKVYLWNHYSLSQETNAECFPGFSQLPKPSEFIYLVSHIVF